MTVSVRAYTAILATALLLAACTSGSHPASRSSTQGRTAGPVAKSSSAGNPTPTAGTSPSGNACPAGDVMRANTADALTRDLDHATPGAVIVLAPGVYRGNFVVSRSGTAAAPITVCGPRSAVLDGGSMTHGYVLHLDGASWLTVAGLTIRDGQKGIVTDHSQHDLLANLDIHAIGDEAVHLRAFSSDNTVRDNVVSDTGHLETKFGEGIYVGSAHKNWCKISNCQPDRSDRNVVQGNTISNTTAENIDIKEGTTGGTITGNHLSGVGMVESASSGWINVKGNAWTITGNTGSASLKDGFQVHEVYPGWGQRNVFRTNHANVDGPGFAFYVQHESLQAVIACDNTQTGAGSGLSNVACTSS